MNTGSAEERRWFDGRESERRKELAGLPLASFTQRLLGYVIDLIVAVAIWAPCEVAWRALVMHEEHIHLVWDFHEAGNLAMMLVYFATLNYFWNGRTVGKWVARTRAVSLTRERLGAWQSVERALGYGAAILEGGLGFVQYFWSENRMCAQDRLAETIVVDARKSAKRRLDAGPGD